MTSGLLDERFEAIDRARVALAKAMLYAHDEDYDVEVVMAHVELARNELDGIA